MLQPCTVRPFTGQQYDHTFDITFLYLTSYNLKELGNSEGMLDIDSQSFWVGYRPYICGAHEPLIAYRILNLITDGSGPTTYPTSHLPPSTYTAPQPPYEVAPI
jgi:hypothetical protein